VPHPSLLIEIKARIADLAHVWIVKPIDGPAHAPDEVNDLNVMFVAAGSLLQFPKVRLDPQVFE